MKANTCSTILIALLLAGIAAVASARDLKGVPDVAIDYSLSADAWWKQHPLNLAAPDGPPAIVSPEPVVDVAAGSSLQKAIDALPATGGTLRLAEGEYAGGFDIIHRANIHLIGQGKVTIRGGQNFVLGAGINGDYGEFCKAAFTKQPEAVAALRELPTHDIFFQHITFEQSPVRLASCRAVMFDGCVFHQPENHDEGAVDADGKKVMEWKRPTPVTGIMGLQGIWLRDCDFQGSHAHGLYLDGAQGSGLIGCRFAGIQQLWMNAVILFTNDDCSLDVTGDGKLEPWERRDIRYFVADGCHFGGGYKRGAIAASGRDVLAQNCVVEGKLDSFLVMSAKLSGKPIQYECFGVIAQNNQLDDVKAIITAEGASNRPTKGIPDSWVWTKYEIGRFTILNNRIPPEATPLREIPRDSQILGPHRIEGNGPAAAAPKPQVGAKTAPPAKAISAPPKPTLANVPYGTHERQVLDFWKAESVAPTPVLFYIHRGGWNNGDKTSVRTFAPISKYLAAGISVVAINYRFVPQAHAAGVKPPVEWPLHDAARALQFVRSKAAEWNLDKARIGATGSSAGACSSLWLAFHDDLADPKSGDPIACESTRLWCAAVLRAQTTLDPQQMKEWTPNSHYGAHAFGIYRQLDGKEVPDFPAFVAQREKILPWIAEYSPYALVSADDPPIHLAYTTPPAPGQDEKDPTHTANFGVKLAEKCRSAGVECELTYPGAPSVKHADIHDFLIGKLKEQGTVK